MTVFQLIEKLQKFSPDLQVEYWDHDAWETDSLADEIVELNGAIVLNPPQGLRKLAEK